MLFTIEVQTEYLENSDFSAGIGMIVWRLYQRKNGCVCSEEDLFIPTLGFSVPNAGSLLSHLPCNHIRFLHSHLLRKGVSHVYKKGRAVSQALKTGINHISDSLAIHKCTFEKGRKMCKDQCE